jgi:hypothetical protein
MTEGRYERMACELMHCRDAIDTAASHLEKYIGLLDKESSLEAFLLGRSLADLEALKEISMRLDNEAKVRKVMR